MRPVAIDKVFTAFEEAFIHKRLDLLISKMMLGVEWILYRDRPVLEFLDRLNRVIIIVLTTADHDSGFVLQIIECHMLWFACFA